MNNTGSGVLTVSLYDTAGAILINGPQQVESNQMVLMQTDGLGAGTFFILIKGNSSDDTSSYTISDSLFSPVQANDKEPNDIVSVAKKLGRNSTKTGHIGYYYNNRRDSSDWFKLTTYSDGLIKLTCRSINNDTIKFTLYDYNGKTILNSAFTTNAISSTIKTDGLAAGTYYVRLTAAKGFTPYILTDSILTYGKYPADREPDNILSRRIPFRLMLQ